MNNRKLMQQIRNHPAVADLYHEQGNGWWYHLRPAWIRGESHSGVWREDTLAELAESMATIRLRVEGDPQ
jgi:hypothetical protein